MPKLYFRGAMYGAKSGERSPLVINDFSSSKIPQFENVCVYLCFVLFTQYSLCPFISKVSDGAVMYCGKCMHMLFGASTAHGSEARTVALCLTYLLRSANLNSLNKSLHKPNLAKPGKFQGSTLSINQKNKI